MIRPTVEVILTYVDKLTAPLRGTSTGVRGAFSDMTKSVTSFVGGFLAVGSITAYLRSAWEAADRFTQSLARVEGTAKIVGVPLEEVQKTAKAAQEQFGLGATAANNFASSAVTMAAKAGDVAKSGELMASVLNLAAARGISAEEALEALNITLKGQDEGLDKLVQKNPSAYYEEWARAAGRSAGSLTDLEKKLAIVDGLIRDGGPVRGAYADWLDTTAGKAFLAGQAMETANARFGVATESLRTLLLGAKVWAAEALGAVVEFFQKLGVDFALAWDHLGAKVRMTLGGIMQAIGETITNSRILQTLLGDGLVALADRMADAGNRMKNDAIRDHRQIEAIRKEMYAEIEGAHALAEGRMTGATEQGSADRTGLSKQEAKEREKIEKEAAEALVKLKREVLVEGMTALGKEMLELQERLDTALKAQGTKERGEAVEAHRQRTAQILAAHAKLDDMVPRMERTHQDMLQITTDWGDETEAVVMSATEEYDRLLDEISGVAAGVEGAADELLGFARQVGAANEEVVSLIGGVANLADGIKQISGATDFAGLLGGIGAAFAGLQGILGSLFGNSPEEQARRQLLRENSQRLRELKNEIGDLLNMSLPGAKLGLFEEATGGMGQFTQGGNEKFDRKMRYVDFAQFLMSQGLSLSDAEALAKDMGLGDIFGDQELSTEEVAQFIEGIKRSEFNQFDQSFSGQQDFLERYFGVAGITDPAMQAEFARTNLQGENDFLFDLIGQFDLSTAEGRAALQEQFAQIFQQLNNGTFDVANFGSLTGSEFVEFIEYFTGLLQQFGAGTPAGPPTTTTVPTTEPPAGEGATLPPTPTVEVPGAPAVFTEGAATDLGNLLGGKLDVLIEQGSRMIGLQESIVAATEATAAATAVLVRRAEGAGNGGFTDSLDLLLQAELDRSTLTQGGG